MEYQKDAIFLGSKEMRRSYMIVEGKTIIILEILYNSIFGPQLYLRKNW